AGIESAVHSHGARKSSAVWRLPRDQRLRNSSGDHHRAARYDPVARFGHHHLSFTSFTFVNGGGEKQWRVLMPVDSNGESVPRPCWRSACSCCSERPSAGRRAPRRKQPSAPRSFPFPRTRDRTSLLTS